MLRVFNLKCLWLLLLLGLSCGKKSRPDKAGEPGESLLPYVPANWSFDADWSGSDLKIKDIKP